MAKHRILVVGGAGYFGARLSEELAQQAEVTVTRRSTSVARDAWVKRAGMQVVDFDSAQHEALPVRGDFQAVINLAMPGAAEASRDPDASLAHALTTTKACLQLLDQGQTGRVLHFSTFHVYGQGGRECYDEDAPPAPVHSYGQIHLECEELMRSHDNTIVARPSNLVGAPGHPDLGGQAKLLFLDLCRQASAGGMKMLNDGLSYRDFLPFGDAISAVRLLLQCEPEAGRLFNLASGEALRLDAVARMIQRATGGHSSVEFGTGTDGFRHPFSIATARLHGLGWEPQASLEEEAGRIVKFFT